MTFIKKINSKGLSLKLGLLVLILSFFSSTCNAKYLLLKNNNLNCLENNCTLNINENQYLKINKKDSRIIELVERKDGKEKLINYIFYTTDISDKLAYSGKPLDMLVLLKSDKITIDHIKLIKHSEPILLTGIPIEKLLEALSFYKGKNIKKKINIGNDSTGEISIPIIAGATVTSLILHEVILDSSREVSKILGEKINNNDTEGSLNTKFKKFTLDDLKKIGAIKNYRLDSNFNENEKADKNSLLIDIYFTDLKHPSIGINILGKIEYEDLFKDLTNNESAILILNKSEWSFKGSGFARGGIYERFHIEQNDNTFRFRGQNFKHVFELELMDIEHFRESGIFILNNKNFKPWQEWKLGLLYDYKKYYADFQMPDKFCVKPETKIYKIWKSKIKYIAMLITLWLTAIIVFIKRDKLSKNSFYLSMIYGCILILDIYIIGIIFEGQPSVVNIFALTNNLKNIKIYILDPCLFIGWVMIIATILIWGKALFCGWICPFGALQEVIFKIRSMLIQNDKSIEFSKKITNKLKNLRYIIFISLLIISFKNIDLAQKLSEIEPFKTTWLIGIKNRPILISSYTVSILIISIFTYRFFCRFICPLGAFLSILSYFTIFRLKRRGTCSVCKICKHKCNSMAINNKGEIDPKECLGCFTCVNNMHNENVCPPFKNLTLRKKYEKNWPA